jgi:hypothetical protein
MHHYNSKTYGFNIPADGALDSGYVHPLDP